MLFIYNLSDIDFLNTCSGRQCLLIANEIVYLTTHTPIKIRVKEGQVETNGRRQHCVNGTILVLDSRKFDRNYRKCLKYTTP